MFRRKDKTEPQNPPSPDSPKGPRLLERVNREAANFARVAVFALIAEAYTVAVAAWICAVLYGISIVLAKDRPDAEQNPYAPFLAILFLVIGFVGFAFARGWHLLFWQAS